MGVSFSTLRVVELEPLDVLKKAVVPWLLASPFEDNPETLILINLSFLEKPSVFGSRNDWNLVNVFCAPGP